MKITKHKCKVCKQDVTCQHEDSTPDEWIARLQNGVTCTECFILGRRFRGAEAIIQRDCARVMRYTLLRLHGEELSACLKIIRESLAKATQIYGEAVSEYRQRLTYWEPEIVLRLIQHPEKMESILKDYRATLERRPKRPPPPVLTDF
jgi:hypothetical protein